MTLPADAQAPASTPRTDAGGGSPPPAAVVTAAAPPPLDVRHAAVAFALSGVSADAARKLVAAVHERRRHRLEAQLTAEIDRARCAERHAWNHLVEANANYVYATQRTELKQRLSERVIQLGYLIRRKRHALEAKKIEVEIDKLDAERRVTLERLGAERADRHQARVAAWTESVDQRRAQAEKLRTVREDLAKAEVKGREAAVMRMNAWMTPTACGFLIWAGYTVIGTTGIAVAALLDDGAKGSLLNDVGLSAVRLMTDLNGRPIHPMIAAPAAILAFLATLVGVVVAMDWLLRWFDKRWLNPRPTVKDGFVFPAKEELSRRTFSKLLVTVPFIYISGVIIAFVAYGGRVSGSSALLGNAGTLLNVMVGSALSLLAASMFVLYFSNILEPRAKDSGWSFATRWEVGVVPLFMLAAIILVPAVGPRSKWAWAGVTTFMLLGAMALAYGLVYRGMFRQLDAAVDAVIECDAQIEEILAHPVIEDPGRAEQREIDRVLADYRTRRQYLLDLDRERRLRRTFLTSDENDTTMLAAYHAAASVLWKVWVRFRRIGPQPDFYRMTDFEAAPFETAERQQCEEQIREIDLHLGLLDVERARAQKDLCQREHGEASQAREAAARHYPVAIAQVDEREVEEQLGFEQAFAVGSRTVAPYEAIAKRRDASIATMPRPKPARPAARQQEVTSGH